MDINNYIIKNTKYTVISTAIKLPIKPKNENRINYLELSTRLFENFEQKNLNNNFVNYNNQTSKNGIYG